MSYKEDYIAKHGEEAWLIRVAKSREAKRRLAQENPEKYQKSLEECRLRNAKRYNNDAAYRESVKNKHKQKYNAQKVEQDFKDQINADGRRKYHQFKDKLGILGDFVSTQYSKYSKLGITNWVEYITNLLKIEAEIDGEPRLVDEKFLYEQFVENVKTEMYFGNVQVLKYFIPHIAIKLYKNKPFTEQDIEMLKFYETFQNVSGKFPIRYSQWLVIMPKEFKYNQEMATKFALLYNILGRFIKNTGKCDIEGKVY